LIVRAQGSLAADESVVVGAKVAGRVAEIGVDLGDLVESRQPLMSLELDDLRLAAKQAEAALEQARAAIGLAPQAPLEKLNPLLSPPMRQAQAVLDEAKLKRTRVERLKLQQAVTEAEWEAVLAAEKVAEALLASALNGVQEKIALIRLRDAELAIARQRLGDAVTLAPFCGVVQQRHVAPGSYVQVGQPIVTIVRTDPLRFRGTIPERWAPQLAIGQDVHLQLDGEGEPCVTKVARISPSLDPVSRALTFEAEVRNPQGRHRAGLFVEAGVVLDAERQTLAAPVAAVVEFAGMEKVWKVVDGSCVEQRIETAARRDGWVEIRSGLSAGDVILTDGSAGRPGPAPPTAASRAAPEPAGAKGHEPVVTQTAPPADPPGEPPARPGPPPAEAAGP